MSNSTKHGVKGRVYLTPEQVLLAARQFGCARVVYNHLLNFSQTRYSHNKTKTSPAQRSLELTRIKTALPCSAKSAPNRYSRPGVL
ncbi:MAG: virulence factor [Acidobacteria bacterium]|nr:MAG: virulence factor [Acidobacteriota bacterium]